VDWFSKAVKFEATHMELTSQGIATCLRDRVFRDHGLPRRIIHDRDPRFVSKYLQELFALIGIRQNPSTAYHPQTDGQTERVNQDAEQYLRIFINYRQDDWKEWLPLAEFSLNDSVHSATGQTPFFINYGYHPWKGQDTRRESQNESADSFAKRMKSVREDAEAALKKTAERMKASHDRHTRRSTPYAIGEKVYLESTNLRTDRPCKKLDDKRHGPFKVKQKVGPASYKLQLPARWPALYPVFNEQYLSPYRSPHYPSQQKPPPPPPLVIEGEPEYDVEEIRGSRRRHGKLQYLVHWKGYPREEDTWEPEKNVAHAKELVEEFHHRNPLRPSLTKNIRAITKPDLSDPRLYDETTDTLGEGFIPPKPTLSSDVILPLPPELLDDLIHTRSLPPPLLARVPSNTKRVWIYETGLVESIQFVMKMENSITPLRLYQFLNPLKASDLRCKYDVLPPRQISRAPLWLLRDHSHHLIQVW
jgi:hypothetical protein